MEWNQYLLCEILMKRETQNQSLLYQLKWKKYHLLKSEAYELLEVKETPLKTHWREAVTSGAGNDRCHTSATPLLSVAAVCHHLSL